MRVIKTFQQSGVNIFKFGYSLFGKPKMYVHCFLIDGLLIDTAQSNLGKEVVDLFSKKPIDQIFITHHHEDHTGNLKLLQKQLNCPTYAHPLCVEMMKNPPSISFAQWITWGSRPANTGLISIENQISTPKYTFNLIPIPGHAVDHIALYEPNQGWLFSADLYVSDYIRYFMRSESMGQQITSIRHILTLDFDTLFCSHNPQFKHPKKRLQAKLQFLEQFYGEVVNLYHKGNTLPKTILQELGKQGKVDLKKDRMSRILSGGELSTLNMVQSVLRDEQQK